MEKVSHLLNETDSRIAAAMLASPRASWRTVGRVLGVSERTVVRRAAPLFHDGTLRATAVRNPVWFPDLIPLALRIRCRPNRISSIAATLARRPDTIWVDVLGGGDEICTILFLDGPDARNALLLRDLPATPAVQSWTSHVLLRVFPAAFDWSGGLLSEAELAGLRPDTPAAPTPSALLPVDHQLIAALSEDGRASYTDLARRADTTPLTARRRLEALVGGQVLRLATEVDLARLGIRTEALLWITVAPGGLEETGHQLSRHPQVRFTSATTGSANLLVAVAAADLNALYHFLSDTIGTLEHITTIEVTPILTGVKRTGLVRPGSL
ncbi:Lrp/AsnC family transcriptional regulator [Streptomyces diastatochromogenes]|uniref:AsnC family transcriptional regulator n=1 Tax=Streptomyces diastatochromogenes TaxID=42236 RepID=A0A233RS37_STRDA|nr:AsnC family transcriptional regulator [Streptomyces diastatochromogenes]MCZ0984698.1 AsnC family transcriptional regulator [Streptomyces diastatochromogenes]OXY86205.1 AsnC family transcriptional regulator [Streptomyces diastatochromogenes]